ncbi:MAG: ABC transporter ATP-binding protein [Candidatus Cloacimonetes bacterium]|nr:ABC transporter ATP-binding protein [Candidatus Cloacimonadota bacterium]MCF7812946.1 ABC transporter ATP-binding protein [Candidatus Cloacimonadota bacterium]MCF7867157.1 ABC transporter ATP-binding protein [Candidatus Cloacimonadota bacterium]MCF7882523.1 ABC transporter ATP-binding protein [Candidatus Cloacimonadota bacterium]
MKIIDINNLTLGYQNKRVIEDLNISFFAGEFCALLGPNGGGKSTFLKSLIGYLKPQFGEILIQGKKLTNWKSEELAKSISLIPQDNQLQFDYSVEELVLMGRFPYLGFWQKYSLQDKNIVRDILEKLDLSAMKNELYSQLSGGERRRVLIARALAQQTEILLLDEAFANLDINHQLEIMQILSEINREEGKLIILVSHNINLSSEYCDRIVMMKQGKIIADGKSENIINQSTLKQVYDADLEVISNPVSGKPNLIYKGR